MLITIVVFHLMKDNILEIIGPGPYKYGNTSLGCDANHSIKKLKLFFETNFPNSKISFFNVTKQDKKCHHVSCYCDGGNLSEVYFE